MILLLSPGESPHPKVRVFEAYTQCGAEHSRYLKKQMGK